MTEAEWLASYNPEAMLQFLQEKSSERKLRLYQCGGCRHIAHLFFSPESLAAVEVTERFVDGHATWDELGKANWDAEGHPLIAFDEGMVRHPSVPTEVFRRLIELGALPDSVLFGGPWQVDNDVTTRLHAAAELAFDCSSIAREEYDWSWDTRYFERVAWPGRWLLDCIFGNPFCPSSLDPVCLTPTGTTLATAAYEARLLPSGELDPDRLAVLADALEEAGCADESVLTHLRSPGPHVRGCWVIDLILGKA